MIGLIGLGNDERTLYSPSGRRLVALPRRLARLAQRAQHWIALRTWR